MRSRGESLLALVCENSHNLIEQHWNALKSADFFSLKKKKTFHNSWVHFLRVISSICFEHYALGWHYWWQAEISPNNRRIQWGNTVRRHCKYGRQKKRIMVQGSQKASTQQQADTCLWRFIASESSDWTNDKCNIFTMHSGISFVTLTLHQLKEWRGRSTSKNTFYSTKKRLSLFF